MAETTFRSPGFLSRKLIFRRDRRHPLVLLPESLVLQKKDLRLFRYQLGLSQISKLDLEP